MQKTVLVGFDGFIDRIEKPIKVKTRQSREFFNTIHEFAQYIDSKSGLSGSVEIELLDEKIGGNMPITSNALGELGYKTISIGAFGERELAAIFHSLSPNCTCVSVADPGICDALEFSDGKLMLAKNGTIDTLDYKKLTARIEEKELIAYFERCDGAAFLNWGELISSNNLWNGIADNILPKCRMRKKTLLIDLSDISRREPCELEELCEIVKKISEYFEIVVSMNENELRQFATKMSLVLLDHDLDDVMRTVFGKMPCKYLILHLLDQTRAYDGRDIIHIRKDIIEKPKYITGGGDNFNAGLLAGFLEGKEIDEAIRIGNLTACQYCKFGTVMQANKFIQ